MRRESCTVVALVGAGTAGSAAEPLLTELEHSANISVVHPAVSVRAQARPARPRPPAGRTAADLDAVDLDAVETATAALRQAARRSSPFALVPADPLAAVAAQWRAMWDVSRSSPAGAAAFEQEAAHALAAWRAGRFELPDYYLVIAGPVPGRPALAATGPASTGPAAARPATTRSGATGPGATGPATTAPAATGPGAIMSAAIAAGDNGPDFYLGPLRATRPHRVAVVTAAGGGEQAAWIRDALRSLRHGPWWPPLDVLLDITRRFFAGGLAEADSSLAAGLR